MGLGTLVGVAVALAVPVWLVLEELTHRMTENGRSSAKSAVPAEAPSSGVGVPAGLRRRAA